MIKTREENFMRRNKNGTSAGRDDGMNYEHINNKNHQPTLLHTHITDVA